jgi:hypothetical protein
MSKLHFRVLQGMAGELANSSSAVISAASEAVKGRENLFRERKGIYRASIAPEYLRSVVPIYSTQ